MSEPSLVQQTAPADESSVVTSGKTPKGENAVLVWVLVILSSSTLVLATLGIGIQQLVLNTDRWVATVGPLASDPRVQSSVANAAATQVLGAIDVQGRVQSLPRPVQQLIAPAESGVDKFVHDQALNIAQSPQFATVWTEVNQQAHPVLVELLRGEIPANADLRVSNGELQLNLLTLVPGLGQSLQQLPVNPLAAAPADFGYVSLASAGGLATAQQAVQLLDRTTFLLIVAGIGLTLATLLVSADRRLTALRLGLCTALGIVLLGIVLLAGQGVLVASVADRPIGGAVEVAVSAELLSLAQFLLVALGGALVVALVAFLMGRRSQQRPRNHTMPPRHVAGLIAAILLLAACANIYWWSGAMILASAT